MILPEQGLPAVNLHVNDSYQWDKTKAAVRYLYDHYLHEYDWFFKAATETWGPYIYDVLEGLIRF